MKAELRSITLTDVDAVIHLVREFAVYEDLEDYCRVSAERLADVMFGEGAFVEGLAAFDGDQMIGYAIYYRCFASFSGERGLYLEDIYVTGEYRRSGTGLQLLRELARVAAVRGLERIDFQVLDWNRPAIAFYLKHGAVCNDDETHYKFSGEAFRALAK